MDSYSSAFTIRPLPKQTSTSSLLGCDGCSPVVCNSGQAVKSLVKDGVSENAWRHASPVTHCDISTRSMHARCSKTEADKPTMTTLHDDVSNKPTCFSDCCVAISKPLVEALVDTLPRRPAVILSIGSGRGLLEHLMLQCSKALDGKLSLDLYGVEVPTCENKYLPEHRMLRVSSTSSVRSDAMFASALLFVYPRQVSLISKYLDVCLTGALERLLWLGHRSDWPEAEELLSTMFAHLERVDGPGIAGYELLVIATQPKKPP